jgi:hypothetical protein
VLGKDSFLQLVEFSLGPFLFRLTKKNRSSKYLATKMAKAVLSAFFLVKIMKAE